MSLSLTNRREFESSRGWRATAKPPRWPSIPSHRYRSKPVLGAGTYTARHPPRAAKQRPEVIRCRGRPRIQVRNLRAHGPRSELGGGTDVSVLIIGKFHGDTAKFRQALTDRADEFAKIGDTARASGGIHHRFGIGDGFVVVMDEWESAEHFQQFFADPALQAFIGSVGAAPVPPELTIAEAVTSPDQY
jgi:hypothetical protein